MKACGIEKRKILDEKYPGLCDQIEAELNLIQSLDCNILEGRTDNHNFTVE